MVRTCSAMSACAAASLARLALAELLAALRSRSRWKSPRSGCCAATVTVLVLTLRATTPELPGGPRVMTNGRVPVLHGVAGVERGQQPSPRAAGGVLRALGLVAGRRELVVHPERLGDRLVDGEDLPFLGQRGRGDQERGGSERSNQGHTSGPMGHWFTVHGHHHRLTGAEHDARSGPASSAIRTGMRWATLTKLPEALSGGSSEKRAPVPPERLSTFPWSVLP